MSDIGAAAVAENPRSRPNSRPQQGMRAYRACVNCRNRKTRCDLDSKDGHPPCKRCSREQRECVLGPSYRGGHRARGRNALNRVSHEPTAPFPTGNPGATEGDARLKSSESGNQRVEQKDIPFPSWFLSTSDASRRTYQSQTNNQPCQNSLEARAIPPRDTSTARTQRPQDSSHSRAVVDSIASADLQNPSDAFSILDRVANSAEDRDSPQDASSEVQNALGRLHSVPLFAHPLQSPESSGAMGPFIHYKPLVDGLVSYETIKILFSSFEQNYHPFFPIVHRDAFDQQNLSYLSLKEHHLFSAILTVASKDYSSNPRVHDICYNHMQQLVLSLITGGDADVEAVEALLLLAEWVCHRPPSEIKVGRGEEDKVAWMYVGTALRLGYFLDLDRTSFNPEIVKEEALGLSRKRLAWAACYMCDRQVSVRLGKAFWSRGPGPMIGLRSQDFPSLQPVSHKDDDYATILQANLELTQLFSNAHDILYSRKGRGMKLMLEGDYVKYIDDFRSSIRGWQSVWGTLICENHAPSALWQHLIIAGEGSPRLKASLLLTYDYLRLYVNAFAYQATVSRAMMSENKDSHQLYRQLPYISAAAPDARFIYESLDAAKSLLTTLNNFVDPEYCLRCMPSRFYLYVIYSAVFLYKAWSTNTMTADERVGIRRLINETIDRLQKASVGVNDMGSRYSRLLQLLWRKPPKNAKKGDLQTQLDAGPTETTRDGQTSQPLDTAALEAGQFTNGGAFSWLDLGAVGTFATQDNSISGSNAGDFDGLLGESGLFSSDMALFTDYRWLSDDNPNLIF